MAANMPPMGAGGPPRRLQNPQLSQLVYSQILTEQIPAMGWHTNIPVTVRVVNASNIIQHSILAMPGCDNQQILNAGLTFEREAFATSPDKATYEGKIVGRVNDLFKKRQANEATPPNNVTPQAAAQNQAQMMMNQNMQMRNVGQRMQPGFQHLQQQMLSPPLNQQGQPAIGVNNPNGLPMNPNQQVLQMGPQMRQIVPPLGMANLSPQDRVKINQLALAKLNSIQEPQRSHFRSLVQQRYGPQVITQLQQEGHDPMLYFFQSQILQSMAKNSPAGNQPGMPIQHHPQRPMNQPVQQLQTGPNGEFGPFTTNVESIISQQKAGLMAQEAGQMVVPASNGTGRNATPQPMASLPGPNQGMGQPTMPHQMPHFNHQPARQMEMDQKAAQSQAQIRAQAQAKQMQGQPGGLNGPGGASQSPAMNTLNAPVRRAPMGVGQTEPHPQMGQGGMPFGQPMMDPRYNHMNQRGVAAANAAANRNAVLQSIFAQMPPDLRQHIATMPPEKVPEMLFRWNASQNANAQMGGRPQSQIGQPGPGNPAAQSATHFAPGNNNGGQQPNMGMGMGMGMNQQNQMLMQQQLNRLRNPNGSQEPSNQNALMDNMNVPIKVMGQLRSSLPQGALPQEIKKWGQLKQWMVHKNMQQPDMATLLHFQNLQFRAYIDNNQAVAAAGSQLPQSNTPQQGVHPNNQAAPRVAQPTPNMAGSIPNITITPQELQSAKNHEKFKGFSDEKIHHILVQMKMRSATRMPGSQLPGQAPQAPQALQAPQAPQAPQPSHANVTAATAATPLQQSADEAAASQRLQHVLQNVHETTNTSPMTQVRNNKQAQNNRATQNAAAVPPSKTSNKRPMPDDAADVPHPSNTPSQRPLSQQQQSGAPSGQPQFPILGPDKLAAMNPEQRQKYEAMLKSRSSAPNQMSEEMMRLQSIAREEFQALAKEQLPNIPMTLEQHRDVAQRIQVMIGEMEKIKKVLGRWYTLAHDDARARLFFKSRMRLIKQFVDGEKMSILKDNFSITPADLDNIRGLFESIVKDVASYFPQNMKKNPSQQNGAGAGAGAGTGAGASASAEPAPQQSVPARPSGPSTQPAPLNAVNLEKQTQALNKVNPRNSKSGQPPAAPTTAQPPFPIGAQSPDGQPTYIGKPTVTQDNLQLPARKRPRIGAGPTPSGAGSNASPQVPIRSSPDMNKRQATVDSRPIPENPQFPCADPYCEFHTIGFTTEEAWRKHMDEEHTKPAEDPIKYAAENLAKALNLDANGKLKKPATTGDNTQSQEDASKQLQTPMTKSESANTQESAMKRLGSATGSKPSKPVKTVTDKAGTPKPESGPATSDGPTPMTMTNLAAAPQAVCGEPMGMTIDPQELLSNVTGLEMGGNGAILDMTVYRSITPKDTPESSNGGASEPNSDVSEGVSLNVALDMGFDSWDPFASAYDIANPDHGSADHMLNMPFTEFSWDDVNPDFDRPFAMDTSLFSLDAS